MKTLDQKELTWRSLKGPQWVRTNHGSLFDRGSADSYYRRGTDPHYGGVGGSIMLAKVSDLSPEEIAEYMAGYQYNNELGDFKDYG